MTVRIVVAGCRDYNDYDEARLFIDQCLTVIRKDNEIIILSGGAVGADSLGERYARENGFKTELYPADWKKYGRSAGPIRNRQMAEACDCAICFWDGKSKGTESMLELANKYAKPVRIKRI